MKGSGFRSEKACDAPTDGTDAAGAVEGGAGGGAVTGASAGAAAGAVGMASLSVDQRALTLCTKSVRKLPLPPSAIV
ncbi:hypothetical protein AB1Y20_023117 [Prymnesium parvum]